MRVCFLSRRFFPAISGMSVYALNLVRQLSDAGHDVVMISQYRGDAAGAAVYGGGPPPPVEDVEVIGLESLGEQRVGKGFPADFECDIQQMVAAIIAAHQIKPFDLIHAQYAYPTGLAALQASRQLDIPNIVSIQGGDGHWVGGCCQTHRAAMQAVLRHAGDLLIGSESFAREVHENHDVAMDQFTIIPGATDIERFCPSPASDGADQLGSIVGPPRFLYHGRVDVRKGLIELIDAMALLLKQIPAAKLIVSGIGPDVEVVLDHVRRCGIERQVDLLGYTNYADAPMVYHRGNIFVSPTYSEGFSNTILEAMASGLPVISTDTIGVVDCLRHDQNGWLVPVGQSAPLAAAMSTMANDDVRRKRLARAGYEDVLQKYSWPVVGRQIIDRYQNQIGKPVDSNWTHRYDPDAVTVATADMNCRFRRSPHLL